ncbi:MAG: ribonuclease P protein component [Patescibacteria group bacterium]
MLPKYLRLSHWDFLVVKASGKSLSFPYFSVLYYPHFPGRVAIVTSTKLSKSAVVRNRLRRQIYSCIPKSDFDIILFPKQSMLKLSHDQISSEIDSLVSKLSH